ncbi:MBL fold metallo-hydrolase [Kibdelosporangium phytohabitans]|uniref:MBL fold metallo-hydrolase n=1 Tax=Kibdelosporangium phytohabitans TaxID=860235 RepID=A0A0N7F3Z4_9PSEU|nr:MBL fold metallo-hydrolase [Kibdelosporangium phytohabitans]ALG09999.1 MBL fold metallo-hydrolase [Kibdelosporangium phytohabitans]MBE1468582.1 glyoxylase-like metal-dependent hydrolase (beta-lactamase superfamily II) [Kibdelosporangium phytohabitans]
MKIAEGLHRIGSDIVNSYLVVDGDGVTIIDAGLPRYWTLLHDELERIGSTLDEVRALILTHGDTDHIGFAARLSREKGIPAYLHPADAARARLQVKKPTSGWGPVKAGPVAGFLWYAARKGGLRIRPAGELRPIEDGEVLDVPGTPRIIHVPGHTPGSVAVHVPAVDALFLGDTMTTRNVLTGATGPKPAPFTLEPGQALASLGRIEEVDATWVLPGHGPAWDGGVTEAVRLIREAADR